MKKPAFEKETVMTQKLARHRLYFQYSELPFRQKKLKRLMCTRYSPNTFLQTLHNKKKLAKDPESGWLLNQFLLWWSYFLCWQPFLLSLKKKNSVSQSNLHQRQQQLLKKLLMPQQQRKAAANNNILSVVWQRLLTRNCSSRFLCCHKFVSKQFLTTLVF